MLHNIATPTTTYLKNYSPPDYLIETVDLTFELGKKVTTVTSRLKVKRNLAKGNEAKPLFLQGEHLELVSIKVNGVELSTVEYRVNDDELKIAHAPAEFDLEIVTHIKPQQNTQLSGLYRTYDIYCTQCEAEGFRRITYFLDRPDVLAQYTTTIIADKTEYPVLLSNGNLIAQKDLPDNRHSATWHDPFKKPCYLFALVAGDLECLEDEFITASGRKVNLKIYSDKGEREKCFHAMESLKQAMRWDEETYGREYDLDHFMIVAIHAFNMGAMENKGLNIFNSKYILAKPETATDMDYEYILAVVGHEYFHNWSGNRVTCRDWFQLSLKEGLTVFREQEFTAKHTSPLVTRIEEVKHLRNHQFKEDAGPLAHPVQPDSYIEINNFYTMTIYEKGAEVIRMMKTLLGEKLFRKGMDLYFARYDGQAVTIEEFVKSMEEASGRDLKQFRRWYHQAGTPELQVMYVYDPEVKTFTLTVKQICPSTPGQPEKKPFHIPLALGFLDADGKDLFLQLNSDATPITEKTRILELKNEIEVFEFVNVDRKPMPSLLRNFSAPVKLNVDYSDQDLQFLFMHDDDGFNKWDAGQQWLARVILRIMNKETSVDASLKNIVDAFRHLLTGRHCDNDFLSELITLPSETYLGEQMTVIDVDGVHQTRELVRKEIAKQLREEFLAVYQKYMNVAYANDNASIGNRSLKETCLAYLMLLGDETIHAMCLRQFENADNMTDMIGALSLLGDVASPARDRVLAEFYQKWQHDALVIDKWLAIQATSKLPGVLQRVKALLQHPAFDIKNPNKVRALIGSFCHNNLVQFHAEDGSGYEFLADQVLVLDKLNPQIAARLLTPMTYWHCYNERRQGVLRKQLERIVNTAEISKDVYEIAAKSLRR